MTRIGKQEERRHKNPKKRQKAILEKTGPKKDNLPLGYKEIVNSCPQGAFIPKIK